MKSIMGVVIHSIVKMRKGKIIAHLHNALTVEYS